MARRVIDGPKKRFLTTKEAADYLEVSIPTFRKLVGIDPTPGVTVPGIRDWMRPAEIDTVTRWGWRDLVTLEWILERRRMGDAGASVGSPSADDG